MTAPEWEDGEASRIEEFAAVLAPADGSDKPILVGGHATNLWSQHFLLRGNKELTAFMPFTSKDLDLVGTGELLQRLFVILKGELKMSEPRSPVVGRIRCSGPHGRPWVIEVLHTVHGLGPADLRRTVDVEVDGIAARTLLPHIMLKAKLANAATIPQDGRQDVKHARMMLICVRGFIEEVLQGVREGALVERAAVNLFGEIFEVVGSPVAGQAANLWDLDLHSIWPLEMLRDPATPKIARWAEHRLGARRRLHDDSPGDAPAP